MVSPGRWRRFSATAGAALVVLLLPSVVPAAAAADVAGTVGVDEAAATNVAGVCPDSTGVTVVVDFKELGGATIVRCVTEDVGKGFTGLDALHAVGIPVQGVSRWGEGFVCRLAGRPSASEELPVEGDSDYKESCVNTPPTTAYWSYWSAREGGAWAYSSIGLKNRDVIPGGFEGWSFSLNKTSPPQPGIAPRRTAPSATPRPSSGSGGSGSGGATTKPSTAPTRSGAAPGGGGSPSKGTSGGKADPQPRGTRSAAAAQPTAADATAAAQGLPTAVPVPTGSSTAAAAVTAGATPTASAATAGASAELPAGDAPAVPASASGPVDGGGGSPVAVVVGLLLVLVPVTGALVAARRRRGPART